MNRQYPDTRSGNAYLLAKVSTKHLDRRPLRGSNRLTDALLTSAPLVAFVSAILWFTQNPLSPGPAVEASAANPLGFLTANFVYDGFINIENIGASAAFLLLVCAFYPRAIRIAMACLLPLIALGAGVLAELTAISSPYIYIHVCNTSCSFYGMSGVASASIGFTIACFLISIAFISLQRRSGVEGNGIKLPGVTASRSQAVLLSGFVAYLVLLLFFSGVLAFPVQVAVHQVQGGSSGSPSPPAILTETAPVAFVHSASLAYGFLLSVSTFIPLSRSYRASRSK